MYAVVCRQTIFVIGKKEIMVLLLWILKYFKISIFCLFVKIKFFNKSMKPQKKTLRNHRNALALATA